MKASNWRSYISSSKCGQGLRVLWIILAISIVALTFIGIFSLAFFGQKAEWSAKLPSDAYYHVDQLDNGTILIAGEQNGLTAFDQDGTTIWEFEGFGMSAISEDGTAYIGTILPNDTETSLCAIAPDGQLLWSHPIGNGTFLSIKTSPDSMIYSLFASQNGESESYQFLAFLPSGELLWQESYPVPISFMVCDNGILLMCANNGWLTSYYPNGTQFASVPISITIWFPVLRGSTIYQIVVESDGYSIQARLYAININGSTMWCYPSESSNPVDYDATAQGLSVDENGTAYLVRHRLDGQGSILSAIDSNGSMLWEYKDDHMGSPSVQDDLIVIASPSKLTTIGKDGSVLWTRHGHYYYDVPPAIAADGTIFALTTPFSPSDTDFGIVAIKDTPTPSIIIIIGAILLAIIVACLLLIWKIRQNGKN